MQEPIRTIKWQYIMYIINVNHKKSEPLCEYQLNSQNQAGGSHLLSRPF